MNPEQSKTNILELSKYIVVLSLILNVFAFFFSLMTSNDLISISLNFSFLVLGLIYFKLTSNTERHSSFMISQVFVIIPAIMTMFNNYLFMNQFYENAIAYSIIFLLTPLTFQLYYKFLISIQYLVERPKLDSSTLQSNNVELPGCSMMIATRNEPFDVCKLTFDSANNLSYPNHKKEIIIVDNSDLAHPDLNKWKNYVEEHQNLNNGTTYKFIHRNSTVGFKPKNLDIGMEHVSQPYVMLLDADSTLLPNTLNDVMPHFIKDPKLGFASFLIKGTNFTSGYFAKIGCISQNLLRYTMNLIGKTGFVIFQGHNSIWSKQTLEKIGPWLEEHKGEPMIVEDVAASMRCYFKGFYGKSIWIDSGEWVPTSLKECESMWMRWTYGNLQITHKYFSKIINSNHITFKEKLDIFNQMFSFTTVLTPIFSILGVLLYKDSYFWLYYVLLLNIPSIINVIGNIFKQPSDKSFIKNLINGYVAFFVMNSFITWVSAKAVFNYVTGKSQGWKPTGKKANDSESIMENIKRYKGLTFASVLAMGIATFMVYYHLENSFQPEVGITLVLLNALYYINLFLNMIIFGNEKQSEEEVIEELSIASC